MLLGWVEDDATIIENFEITLSESPSASEYEIQKFDHFEGALKEIEKYNLSILIVDLKNAATEELDGKEILTEVFSKHFCPIIVHSAFPEDTLNEDIMSHPLVEYVQKGKNSDQKLLAKINEIKEKIKFIEEVRQTTKEINYLLLKNWYPSLASINLDDKDKSRLFIRRFAASLDFAFHLEENSLNPWEIYLYPPLPGTDLLTGDILKKRDDGTHRLVLSPSCDLVKSNGRTPKVTNVLIAHLDKVEDILRSENELKDITTSAKLKDRMAGRRKAEPEGGKILLPRLNNTDLPGFCVDLKKLSLIPINNIGETVESEKEYNRVASIDSPFRENISGLIAKDFGRLGLPDLDMQKWANACWDVHPKKPSGN